MKEDESFSLSAGFTIKAPDANLTMTIDAFFTAIDDRVVLTGNFAPDQATQSLFDQAGATRARFFANAIDTETKGFDIVISHKANISDLRLTSDLAMTVNRTLQVDEINSSSVLATQAGTFFGQREEFFLELASPRFKANLGHILQSDNWRVFLRNSYFGAVTNPDQSNVGPGPGFNPEFGGKILTDISFGYNLTDNLTLTVGSSNVFDVYPDASPSDLTSGNNFIYPRVTSQFGINGRTVFGRLNFKL